jgi:hypothetical protein
VSKPPSLSRPIPGTEEWNREVRRVQKLVRLDPDPDPKLSEALASGVRAQLQAQAPPPPMIIYTLQVLLDPAPYPPDHVQWVRNSTKAILAKWERCEDPKQLKRDLGLTGPKRRKSLTAQRELALASAIVDATVAGDAKPNRTAGDKLQADEREVQRAWKKWKPVYLARLELLAIQASPEDRSKIRAAIDHLKSRDTK